MFRLRSTRSLHKPGLLLAACLLASSVASAMEVPPAPTKRCDTFPDQIDPIRYCANGAYLCVGTALRPLVGVSADAGCHIPLSDQTVCNWSNSKDVIDSIASKGLNKMRLWVSLAGNSPVTNQGAAHPFVYVPATNTAAAYWRLDQLNDTYFQKLENAVYYAQLKNITVEVTFFAPWQGTFAGGPWDRGNGKACVNGNNLIQTDDINCTRAGNRLKDAGFSNQSYFVRTASDPVYGDLPRQVQLNLIQGTVKRLWCYDKVYWEIANEPEGSVDPTLVSQWHVAMVAQAVDADESRLGKTPGVSRRHRIAVNPSNTTVNYLGMANVDLVNGHYTELYTPQGNMGAIQLIRGSGNSAFNSGKLLGFNETKISSIDSLSGNSFTLPLIEDPVTGKKYGGPESARAEGWEFMVNRGAVYDHWGYRYDSQIGQDVRAQMGHLRTFISGLPLRLLARSSADGTVTHPAWLPNLLSWGTFRSAFNARLFWAALEPTSGATTRVYVLYLHNSLRRCKSGTETSAGCSYLPLNGYNPVMGTDRYAETLTLSLVPGRYTVEWIRPKDRGSLKTPFTLTYNSDNSCTGGDSALPCQIKSPSYDYDIALKITQAP